MLKALTTLLENMKELSWNKVLLLAITSSILLLSYFVWTELQEKGQRLETLEKKVEQFDAREEFQDEFGLSNVSFEPNIELELDRLRTSVEGEWVMLWGFHEAKSIGPVYLKRVSVISESSEVGYKPLFTDLQNLNISLFSNAFSQYWKESRVYHQWIPTMHDRNYRSFMTSLGVYWQSVVPIYIDTFPETPVGIIGVYYSRYEGQKMSRNLVRREAVEKQLKQTAEKISYELNSKLKQYK